MTLKELKSFITWANFLKVLIAFISILVFYIAYKIIKKIIGKKAKEKLKPHNAMLVNKVITYAFYIVIVMYILGLFGINLKAVWGAAGIAGVAVGFAAQTSISNLISGLFVLGERALQVGDYISVAGESGVVDSVGLLSVKIHTLDNQMVRIPNSTIINSNLMNYNSYSKRRCVFEIPISYETDLTKALNAIKKVPALCPTVLTEPEPTVYYDGFGDAVNLKLAVWMERTDLIQTKNDVYINVIKVCQEDGVEIPYTHFDIRILDDKKSDAKVSAKKSAGKTKTGAGKTLKK